MRIRLIAEVYGAWRGKLGDEVERPDVEAQRLIRAGFAVPVKDAAKLETTTVNETLETATKPYNMGLQALTTSVNPITMGDVKTHLRIADDLTPVDGAAHSSDEPALAVFLAAAFEYVETETRQQLCNRNYLLTLDAFPTDRFFKLPKPPLMSVASVAYTDAAGNAQVVDPSTYSVDTTSRPGRIVLKPGRSWPHDDGSANCVRVTFTAGYGEDGYDSNVPVILKQCILLLVGHYYENREGAIDRRVDCIPLGVESIIIQNSYPEAVG